jgi:hypothetical protein
MMRRATSHGASIMLQWAAVAGAAARDDDDDKDDDAKGGGSGGGGLEAEATPIVEPGPSRPGRGPPATLSGLSFDVRPAQVNIYLS